MWIKVSEAARRIGLSKGSIYNLIHAPDTPLITKRFGNAIMIDEKSFEQWMESSPTARRSAEPADDTSPEVAAIDERIEAGLRFLFAGMAERNAALAALLTDEVTMMALAKARARAIARTKKKGRSPVLSHSSLPE